MRYRVGHDILSGKYILKKYTIIDIVEEGEEFTVVSEEGKMKTFRKDSGEIYALLCNGYEKPQRIGDTGKGTITVETKSISDKLVNLEIGTKVKFKNQFNKS